MTAPIFSGERSAVPEAATPINPPVPFLDTRTDFNVVFIHSRLDDYGLSPAEFRTYAHLARRAGTGAAWPAVATIAATCRLEPKTVRKAIAKLVRHRLIERQPRPGSTHLYQLTPAAAWTPPDHIDGHPSQTATPPANWEDTPAVWHQGHPSQTAPDEGNPLEGNTSKRETYTHRPAGLPRSEDEAVTQAELAGVPPEFARVEFCRLESTGGLNGAGIPVRNWPAHIRKRWADDQSQRAERRATGRPSRPTGPPRTFAAADYNQPVSVL